MRSFLEGLWVCRAMDLLAMTSDEADGFELDSLQSMAYNKPTVSVNIRFHPEALTPEGAP